MERRYPREFAAQRTAAGLEAITLGHTERITRACYGRVTDGRLIAVADVFSPP
jgi:hypothetical protein